MQWLPSAPLVRHLRLTSFNDDCSPYGRAVFYCAFFLRWECGLEGGRKWERKELTAERDAKISAEEMSAKTVVEIAEEAPVKKQVRQRIHRDVKPAKATTVNPNADKIKSKVMVLGDVEQLSSHNDDATQDTGVVLEPESDKNKIVWTDIDSVHAAFMVKVQGLNTEKAELLAKLTSETNTDDALGYTQQLQKVLCDKKKYETVLNKLNVMQQELQQIKQDFSNQM